MPAMQGASHEVFHNIGFFLLCNSIAGPVIDFSSVMRSDLGRPQAKLVLVCWWRVVCSCNPGEQSSTDHHSQTDVALEGIAKEEKGMDQPQAQRGVERDET